MTDSASTRDRRGGCYPAAVYRGAGPRVLIVGGCDVHLRLDLMRLLRRTFSVGVLGSEEPLRERFAAAGFPYVHYSMTRGSNPVADLKSTIQLYRLFRRLRPDVVHTFATKPSVWGRVAAHLAGVPVVVGTLPGLGSLYMEARLRARILRRIYEPLQSLASNVSDLTIFQNRDDAREFTTAKVAPAAKATVVLGSGVRTDLFDPERIPDGERQRIRTELGIAADAVVVTMISRVIRSKGVMLFVEAATRLREQSPSALFLLVGPDDQDSLDRLTRLELDQLKESVRWLGPRRDVRELLAVTDLCVLPALYREGIPRVLLEAASMGLPLVATRIPGCVEVVRNGRNGYLVPPKDVAAFTAAVGKLISNPDERRTFGRASREIAVRKFDIEVIANHCAELYRSLLYATLDRQSRGLRAPVPPPARQQLPWNAIDSQAGVLAPGAPHGVRPHV